MKCKVFKGKWYEAMDAFNAWAKGKALNKAVIIHSHTNPFVIQGGYDIDLTIVVFHPEGDPWEGVQS